MKALTALLVVGMFATRVAMADDVDDIKAAEDSYYAAINSGDAHAWAQSRLAVHTDFGAGGADCWRDPTLLKKQGRTGKPNLMLVSNTISKPAIST